MPNLSLIKKYNRVHMIGIGGVSMSGIAEILNYFGVTVTGSDLADSEIVKKLQKNGIPVTIGHDFENLSKADIVVYSAAINPADPEMQKAKELRLQFVPSAVLFCKKVRSSSFYVGDSTRSQSFLEIKKDMYQIYSILRKKSPPTLGQTSR